MIIIGIESEGTGTNEQIRGVILTGRTKNEPVPVARGCLIKALDGQILHRKNFTDDTSFKEAVSDAVSEYLKDGPVPNFVVLPINHSALEKENADVDLLSVAVKEAFAKHGHSVETMVLASNLYDYQHVDLIHVGEHLLSHEDEAKLLANSKLKQRVVKTLGVPSNISWQYIGALASRPETNAILKKYQGKKNVLFSLGGKTENDAIKFTIKDAENLLNAAIKLKAFGYNVIFTNSPRTPNDVTDYLFEKCKIFHMDFYNSKKVATTEEERTNFRVYDGKHNAEFQRDLEEIGNIYPAILSVCDFAVYTHDSFSYTSDAAAIGLPSVVYTKNEIDASRPDCHKLFKLCCEQGHVMDLDEALACVKEGKPVVTKKMDNISQQLVTAMKAKHAVSRGRTQHRETL